MFPTLINVPATDLAEPLASRGLLGRASDLVAVGSQFEPYRALPRHGPGGSALDAIPLTLIVVECINKEFFSRNRPGITTGISARGGSIILLLYLLQYADGNLVHLCRTCLKPESLTRI
jgi:hypothetical protein